MTQIDLGTLTADGTTPGVAVNPLVLRGTAMNIPGDAGAAPVTLQGRMDGESVWGDVDTLAAGEVKIVPLMPHMRFTAAGLVATSVKVVIAVPYR